MTATCRFLLAGWMFLAASAQADVGDIVAVECDAKAAKFSLRYVAENDDFFAAKPRLPISCRVGGENFSVTGMRGRFAASGQCGAQPPIYISVSRNGMPLLMDATLGADCFGGPSLASLSVTTGKKGAQAIQICVYLESDLMNIHPQQKPVCAFYQERDLRFPLTQAMIDKIARAAETKP